MNRGNNHLTSLRLAREALEQAYIAAQAGRGSEGLKTAESLTRDSLTHTVDALRYIGEALSGEGRPSLRQSLPIALRTPELVQGKETRVFARMPEERRDRGNKNPDVYRVIVDDEEVLITQIKEQALEAYASTSAKVKKEVVKNGKRMSQKVLQKWEKYFNG